MGLISAPPTESLWNFPPSVACFVAVKANPVEKPLPVNQALAIAAKTTLGQQQRLATAGPWRPIQWVAIAACFGDASERHLVGEDENALQGSQIDAPFVTLQQRRQLSLGKCKA
jgi:hypothetical protein